MFVKTVFKTTFGLSDVLKITFSAPLLEKQSEELSYPFRSVQCTLVDGLKSFSVAYMGVILSLN